MVYRLSLKGTTALDVHIFKSGKYQVLVFVICLGCIAVRSGNVGNLTAVLFCLFVLATPGVAWEALFLYSNRISFDVGGALIRTIARIFVLFGAILILIGVEKARVGPLFALYAYVAGMCVGVYLERRYPDTSRLCRDFVLANSPNAANAFLGHCCRSRESEYAYPVIEVAKESAVMLLAQLALDEKVPRNLSLKLGPLGVLLVGSASVDIAVVGGKDDPSATSALNLELVKSHWLLRIDTLWGIATWSCDVGDYRFVKNFRSVRVTCFNQSAVNRIRNFLREFSGEGAAGKWVGGGTESMFTV